MLYNELYDKCRKSAVISNIKTRQPETVIWYTITDKDTVIYHLENYGHEDQEINYREITINEFKEWISSLEAYGREIK